MAIFFGTEGADRIIRDFLSPGVLTDPPGLVGTDDDMVFLEIYGYGGDDIIRFSSDLGRAFGGEGNDVIDVRGEDKADHAGLWGGAGDDLLLGGDGSDWFVAGAGRDTMYGGKRSDSYSVDSNRDRIVEFLTGGKNDEVFSDADYYKLPNNVENLYLGFYHAQVVIGNDADNIITGYAQDTIQGKGGDDYIRGSSGSILRGGRGHDTLDAADAEVIMHGGPGNDLLDAAGPGSVLTGGTGRDEFRLNSTPVSQSLPRIVIDRTRSADAFEGAGAAAGDLFDLTYLSGYLGRDEISFVNSRRDTLLLGNADSDGFFELQVIIRDGPVHASAYTAADFVL